MKVLQIGFGKAGKHIAKLLLDSGFELSIHSRSLDESIVAKYEGYNFMYDVEKDSFFDVVVFAVPDCKIFELSRYYSSIIKARFCLHLSGATSIEVLRPFSDVNNSVGLVSLHPNISFADEVLDDSWYDFVYFGLTASDEKSYDFIVRNFNINSSNILKVADIDKAKYHAAAVLSSNLIMPILNSAVHVYKSIGIDDEFARKLTSSLAVSACQNLKHGAVKDVITGPLARKDYKTVEKHLLNLNGSDRDVYDVTSNWLKEII